MDPLAPSGPPTPEHYARIALYKAVEAHQSASEARRALGYLTQRLEALEAAVDALRASLRDAK